MVIRVVLVLASLLLAPRSTQAQEGASCGSKPEPRPLEPVRIAPGVLELRPPWSFEYFTGVAAVPDRDGDGGAELRVAMMTSRMCGFDPSDCSVHWLHGATGVELERIEIAALHTGVSNGSGSTRFLRTPLWGIEARSRRGTSLWRREPPELPTGLTFAFGVLGEHLAIGNAIAVRVDDDANYGVVALLHARDGSVLWTRGGDEHHVGFGASLVSLGDWNLDRRPDLAVLVACRDLAEGNHVQILDGVDGSTLARVELRGRAHRMDGLGDLDGDGLSELLVDCHADDLNYVVSPRTGVELDIAGGMQLDWAVETGDVDGDGHRDALVARRDAASGQRFVSLFSARGLRDMPLETPSELSASYWVRGTAGDFDGDGRHDLALVWNDHGRSVLRVYDSSVLRD